jgi:ABC-2 type transport system ATP-binding protein
MMLEIRDLCKKYDQIQALDHLNLEIEEGELFGFVGQNGAGKTTTIRILAGLLIPDQGAVRIRGEDLEGCSEELRSKIGYVPDSFGVYDNLKVWEYMDFYARLYGTMDLLVRNRCRELLDRIGLGEKEDVYVDGLSRGMKLRLSVARALIHRPELLILDEPTSGLDPRNRQELIALLKEIHREGTTIFISSHILSELGEMCTSIGILDQGKMVLTGSLSQIMNQVNTANPLEIEIQENQETAMRLLRAHPLVESLSVLDHRITVRFQGDADKEADLLRQLIQADVLVKSFHRRESGLESIFMQVTERENSKVVMKE